jgi:hypothetical protein
MDGIGRAKLLLSLSAEAYPPTMLSDYLVHLRSDLSLPTVLISSVFDRSA